MTTETTREYGYTLWARPQDNDGRAVDKLPALYSGQAWPLDRERTLHAARYIVDLEVRQGYKVERIENWSRCAACSGTGTMRVKPKGWRKRSAPPWFMCKTVPCGNCRGVDTHTVDERIDR